MERGDAVAQFAYEIPSLDSYWRAIVLFGQNVASYKFALAGALLDIDPGTEVVSLDQLALPFASRVAEHLRAHDKQGTSQQSRFLDACRAFNNGELDADGLRAKTVQLGFANVIDAFHIVDRQEVPERFFIDERRQGAGLRLTDGLRKLLDDGHGPNLAEEAEARWRLVETAWELNLPRQLLTVEFQPVTNMLVVPRRRTDITGARAALNGYQKGHCFYCYTPIEIASGSASTCHIDHVFPWSTGPMIGGAPADGVWNLVLACPRCNGWQEKSDRPPHESYVERLNIRNEFLIASYHPLRPTLMAQTGSTPSERAATLKRALDQVSVGGARAPWTAPEELLPAF
ncbi:MAG: HNH endonuclease domain-containing protein [Mycobacterium sp.]